MKKKLKLKQKAIVLICPFTELSCKNNMRCSVITKLYNTETYMHI